MPRIHVMLSEEHLEKLERLADGRPRSLVLQRLIDEATDHRRAAEDPPTEPVAQ
ncbi:hypothetical protein NBH00_05305 [Paraconexibacter antarcticus]|uniref:Ribbon-helix-helix CopG family protein n=1 Tax=Paraconexibacter antarcticus TaxID=2949664 RepID=A0ABY5DUD3_9ACTN|nr:hypothetical protein [Paraconexibacter antarcticus]UTI65628.1 hypothetical protein NBH00_05305 [Paraconexibacter antarcticus]